MRGAVRAFREPARAPRTPPLPPPPTHTPLVRPPACRHEGVEPEALMQRSYRQFQAERALPALEARAARLEVSASERRRHRSSLAPGPMPPHLPPTAQACTCVAHPTSTHPTHPTPNTPTS